MAEQLTLWDEELPKVQPPPERLPLDQIPDGIIFRTTRWADGDKRPEALERLARVKMGDLESIKDCGGISHFFRVVSTKIVGDEVEMACKYLCPVRDFYGKRADNDDDDDEVD